MNTECRFCGALKWKEESAGMCSSGRGKVALPSIDGPVEPLKELFSYETDESRRFLKNSNFGGLDIILIGDLRILPPVRSTPIYKQPKQTIVGPILW
ncbi:uncharacterized protein TNCV_2772851 [Trichonephila clavipes]|nr:uncharacterized protein TNCV_2772851 [Trichonephila clavipes]